jgi:hypothetical protein
MDATDVRNACAAALNRLFSARGVCRPVERGSPDEHVCWMLGTIPSMMESGRREKAMRWLGFVQGYLWAIGAAEIDEMKNDNRPQAA